VAAGLEPIQPSPIPDAAFRPVVVSAAAPSPTGTPDLEVLRDRFIPTSPPDRPQPSIEPAKPILVKIAPPAPASSGVISGVASWYCRAGSSPCTTNHPDGAGFDAYAAAGPALRAAIGPDWRGTIITVDGIRVKLIDWCQCYRGEPGEKLLDLYYDVFARTGSTVTVRW
jgi:hypothetical protein